MIFAETCDRYWDLGLPAIPLMARDKRPAVSEWQKYATEMPSEGLRADWKDRFASGNIGMPLGALSGLVAIDLDTDEPEVLEIIKSLVPLSKWVRRGKKGAVYVYKWQGQKTSRIKGEEGNTIVEILSRGTQIVLPPSIHPDTQMPYVANCELTDVLDQLAELPVDFETRLRKALIDAGIKLSSRGSVSVTKWVPAGGRDSAMVAMAGLLSRGVIKGERTLLEALDEAEAWVANFTENVIGDPMDPMKARDKVMEFLRRDVVENQCLLPEGWTLGLTPEEVKAAKEYLGEDMEEWGFERYQTYLLDKFTEVPMENMVDRMQIIDEVLLRLAKDKHMNIMEQNALLVFISQSTRGLTNNNTLRKRIKELQTTGLKGIDQREIALAAVKELEQFGQLRTVGTKMYQWEGSYWKEITERDLTRVVIDRFGDLPAARKYNDYMGIVKTMRTQVEFGIKGDENIVGINFANGFLTPDLQLRDHDPKYGCTYVLNFQYKPAEAAPLRFLGHLDRCWGEDSDYAEKVQGLREAMAATLFGVAWKYSKAFCLYGAAKTGKSVIKEVMEGMIPEDASSSVPPECWGDKFMPATMLDKLANFCGELSDTQMISGERFKEIVEGGQISAQFKGKDIFQFKPTCAQWFASNFLPKSRDSSVGFARRWLFFKFSHPLTNDEEIPNYAQVILSEEVEAIASWAAPAIADLMLRGHYMEGSSHIELIRDISNLNNNVRYFLNHCREVVMGDDVGSISTMDLYNQYYLFTKLVAKANPVQMKRFEMMMDQLASVMRFTVVGESYVGIGVKK